MSATVGPIAVSLVGAGGAIIGGAIASASNLLIETQRNKRAARQQETIDSQDLRVAARLVSDELDKCSIALQAAKETSGWRGSPKKILPVDCWQQRGPVLARQLSYEDWDLTREAYRKVQVLLLGGSTHMSEASLADPTIDAIEEASQRLQVASA
jgi:hypothetical protein